MKTALQEAIEAVEKHMETMTGEWADVYGIVVDAAKKAQQPRQEWRTIEEWHEDYGDCLFMFFRNGEFYAIEFTSPLATTFDEEYTPNCDQIFFKRVETSDFKLPSPPKEK